jgi:hypothetical protein
VFNQPVEGIPIHYILHYVLLAAVNALCGGSLKSFYVGIDGGL